jgi:hypothetical protein
MGSLERYIVSLQSWKQTTPETIEIGIGIEQSRTKYLLGVD